MKRLATDRRSQQLRWRRQDGVGGLKCKERDMFVPHTPAQQRFSAFSGLVQFVFVFTNPIKRLIERNKLFC